MAADERHLTRADKAQLPQWGAHDLGDTFPGVESIPGVCGGEPCIAQSHIPVWLLEQAWRLGTSEADLLLAYPTLHAQDLANASGYVRAHPEQVDQQIKANEDEGL